MGGRGRVASPITLPPGDYTSNNPTRPGSAEGKRADKSFVLESALVAEVASTSTSGQMRNISTRDGQAEKKVERTPSWVDSGDERGGDGREGVRRQASIGKGGNAAEPNAGPETQVWKAQGEGMERKGTAERGKEGQEVERMVVSRKEARRWLDEGIPYEQMLIQVGG